MIVSNVLRAVHTLIRLRLGYIYDFTKFNDEQKVGLSGFRLLTILSYSAPCCSSVQ